MGTGTLKPYRPWAIGHGQSEQVEKASLKRQRLENGQREAETNPHNP